MKASLTCYHRTDNVASKAASGNHSPAQKCPGGRTQTERSSASWLFQSWRKIQEDQRYLLHNIWKRIPPSQLLLPAQTCLCRLTLDAQMDVWQMQSSLLICQTALLVTHFLWVWRYDLQLRDIVQLTLSCCSYQKIFCSMMRKQPCESSNRAVSSFQDTWWISAKKVDQDSIGSSPDWLPVLDYFTIFYLYRKSACPPPTILVSAP